MADVNQTRAALQHQLSGTPYRMIDTPAGARVEYAPIQDGFASDNNAPTAPQRYAINIELRPQNSWAILTRGDTAPTTTAPGQLVPTRQAAMAQGLSPYAYNLLQAGDPQPVQAMVLLVSSVIEQHGWRIESAGRANRGKVALLLGISFALIVLLLVFSAVIFILGARPV